jgi:serine protease AprX
MRVGFVRRAALAGALLGLLVIGVGGSSALATGTPPVGAVEVDADLQQTLRANPTGGVTAIVTTWNRSDLDAVEAAGVRGARLSVLPMLITSTLTQAQLDRLSTMAQVRSVWGKRVSRLSMEDTTWITKARYVWAESNGSGDLPGFGVTGRNVELAVIDTGADGLHEDMDNLIEFCEAGAENVPATSDFVRCSPWPNGFNLAGVGTGTNPRTDCAVPPHACDDDGHGSHVSGTVAGTGHASGGTQATHSTIGMSPHAKLRVYSANVAIGLLNWQTLAAYDDLVRKKLAGYNRVIAVNNSWGGGDGTDYNPDDPHSVAIKAAYDAGIVSVFAAGNSGPEHNTLSSTCISPYAVCVAASTKPDQKMMFSSVGRPSQPTDTNRDGEVGPDDVEPDNHDWRLGQAHGLGRYRPTLAAPGVNINSISANSAGCREDNLIIPGPQLPKSGCYELLNGTSMAAPHVTGAVGLIAQAFRSTHGRMPRPDEVIEILERSSNMSKLPGWDAEEQGYGRLDVHEAVKFARMYPNGLRRGNLGYPTPPYQQGQYPRGPENPDIDVEGCTAAGSWTLGDIEGPGLPEVLPTPPRYGQHFIDVGPKTERIRITVRWTDLANLYVRIWRPDVEPGADTNPAGPTRTFPDNEALGLLEGLGPFLGPERLLEIRAPEEGRWTVRVFHRAGEASGCGETQETPTQTERAGATQYDFRVELPRVTHQPSVTIDQPAANAQTTGRWVDIRGRAGYPPHAQDPPPAGNTGSPWEGVTNWAAPGSARSGSPHDEPNPANPRPVLYFHGNPHIAGDPSEQACTGDGRTDNLNDACAGPKLLRSDNLFEGAAASWKGSPAEWTPQGLIVGDDRLPIDPNWVWCLAPHAIHCPARDPAAPAPPVAIAGPMTVEWWASCGPLCLEGGPDWFIRLWVDGVKVVDQQVAAGPSLPNVPERLRATIDIPPTTANQRVTLHVEPVFLIDQYLPFFIYYDSDNPCIPNATAGACDSLVRMPVGSTGAAPGGTAPPENVRVTDLPMNAPYPTGAPQTPALRVAWDEGATGTTYEVYRSTNPATVGSRVFRGAGTSCSSPEAPAPEAADIYPGHDVPGRCFTDTGVSLRTTYYYRVYAVLGVNRSQASEIAYNTPTRYDRQVRVKLDRLYGPQHWEFALVEPNPNPTLDIAGTQWRHLWDTLELSPGLHDLFARSFTQGIGSTKATRTVRDDGTNPPPPPPGGGCPDDDDGDGDDDEEDGDDDDNGDDDDDDCEDDDDHEEDEDD